MVPTSSSTSRAENSQPRDRLSSAKSSDTVAVDGQGVTDADRRPTVDRAGGDDTDSLRRRLRDTVEMCQRLATILDDRHTSWTTHDVGQRQMSSSNPPPRAAQPLSDVDEVYICGLTLQRLIFLMPNTHRDATQLSS